MVTCKCNQGVSHLSPYIFFPFPSPMTTGVITEYRIYLLLPLKNETIYRGENRNFVVNQLQPASDYSVQLQACTGGGCTIGIVQQFR